MPACRKMGLRSTDAICTEWDLARYLFDRKTFRWLKSGRILAAINHQGDMMVEVEVRHWKDFIEEMLRKK